MRLFLLMFFIFCVTVYSQTVSEYPIQPWIDLLNAGNKTEALKRFTEQKQKTPNDAAVLYFDALVTEDGAVALEKFREMYNKNKKSQWADDALFRLYAYYFAAGGYNTATDLGRQMRQQYPNSPYLPYVEGQQIAADVNQNQSTQSESNEFVQREDYSGENSGVRTEKNEIKSTKGWNVQAGAFLELVNAQLLEEKLQNANFGKTWVGSKSVAGTSLAVVYLGPFATKEKAEEQKTKLKNQMRLTGFLVYNDH